MDIPKSYAEALPGHPKADEVRDYDVRVPELISVAALTEARDRIAAAGRAGELAREARALIDKQPSLSGAKAWDIVRSRTFGLPLEYIH